MKKFLLSFLCGFAACFAPSLVRAELPSLMSEKLHAESAASEQNVAASFDRGRFEFLRERRWELSFANVGYRLADGAFRASVERGGVFTHAVVGSGGDRRLEIGRSSFGGELKFVATEESGSGAYRIEFVRRF